MSKKTMSGRGAIAAGQGTVTQHFSAIARQPQKVFQWIRTSCW